MLFLDKLIKISFCVECQHDTSPSRSELFFIASTLKQFLFGNIAIDAQTINFVVDKYKIDFSKLHFAPVCACLFCVNIYLHTDVIHVFVRVNE